MKILVNHIGYELKEPKQAVIEYQSESPLMNFAVINKDTGAIALEGEAKVSGKVARWKDWFFYTLDFSTIQTAGKYFLRVSSGKESFCSETFQIDENLLPKKTLDGVIRYFKSQRCSSDWEAADHDVPVFGSDEKRVDVHGGWYDASGDVSKYLSHLSYANYMNPQQTPMVVWNFLQALENNDHLSAEHRASVTEEALHGADFLVRMQDPSGAFYMIVFDQWSKDTQQREVCDYRTQDGIKLPSWQAGWRQGGGMAIAALARASQLQQNGGFSPKTYLDMAIKGYQHLKVNNLNYLDDGQENIIDDYCALLAGVELYHATGHHSYYTDASKRALSLLNRISTDDQYSNWWRSDERGDRPYFHAAEEGLPIISLLRYLKVVDDAETKEKVLSSLKAVMKFHVDITNEVENPFGYARQYVKPLNGEKQSSFFFPHENESGYWWQGENARLASLATAAKQLLPYLEGELEDETRKFIQNQLNWILGANPYDTCMLHGYGRNNFEYLDDYPNAPGGVCNGITGGFYDEQDIDFATVETPPGEDHSWRWAEQWIPHGSWYFLALCA